MFGTLVHWSPPPAEEKITAMISTLKVLGVCDLSVAKATL